MRLNYLYLWLNTLITLLKLFRPIYFHISSYSFTSPISWTKKVLIMSSSSQKYFIHKLKKYEIMIKIQMEWLLHLTIYQTSSLQRFLIFLLGKTETYFYLLARMDFRSCFLGKLLRKIQSIQDKLWQFERDWKWWRFLFTFLPKIPVNASLPGKNHFWYIG